MKHEIKVATWWFSNFRKFELQRLYKNWQDAGIGTLVFSNNNLLFSQFVSCKSASTFSNNHIKLHVSLANFFKVRCGPTTTKTVHIATWIWLHPSSGYWKFLFNKTVQLHELCIMVRPEVHSDADVYMNTLTGSFLLALMLIRLLYFVNSLVRVYL